MTENPESPSKRGNWSQSPKSGTKSTFQLLSLLSTCDSFFRKIKATDEVSYPPGTGRPIGLKSRVYCSYIELNVLLLFTLIGTR